MIFIVEPSSPVLIAIVGTSPLCGLNVSQYVGNKQKSTSSGLVRQSQKLDAVIDGNFSENQDSTSIFSKVNRDKLSNGSSEYLYMHCRMNFSADPVQTQTP